MGKHCIAPEAALDTGCCAPRLTISAAAAAAATPLARGIVGQTSPQARDASSLEGAGQEYAAPRCLSPYRSHSADMTEHVGISEPPGLGEALYRARGCAIHGLLCHAPHNLRCCCCCYSPCRRHDEAEVTPNSNPRRIITGGISRTRVRNTVSATPRERQKEGTARGWLVIGSANHQMG